MIAALLALAALVVPAADGGPTYVAVPSCCEAPATVTLYGEEVPPSPMNWLWGALIRCEVRGQADRYDAGLPADVWHGHIDGGLQIIKDTWKTYGGEWFAPRAGLATAAEQIAVATAAYEDAERIWGDGLHPWSCQKSVPR